MEKDSLLFKIRGILMLLLINLKFFEDRKLKK